MNSVLSRLPKAVQAAGTGTAIAAVAAGVAFLANLMISLQLGPGQRGQVAFVLQASYLVAPLIMLGADSGLLRADSAKNRHHSKQHLLPMSIILAAALFAAFRDWTVLAAPIAYAASWMVLSRSISYRDHDFRGFALVMLAYQAFIAASSILLFLLSVQAWWVWLLPYAAPAIAVLGYDIARSDAGRFRHPFKYLTSTSLSLLPMTISLVVILRLDRVFVGIMSGDSQLGLYVTVATATETLSWMGSSIADHRVAHLKRMRTRQGLLGLLARDLLIFGCLAALVAISVLYVLLPLLGTEYLGAAPLVLPLTLAALALAIFRQTVSWALAGRQPRRVSALAGITAILAIPIYAWAIYEWAAMGAAWASLCVYTMGAIIGVTMARDDRAKIAIK